jgi:hypothetical protein
MQRLSRTATVLLQFQRYTANDAAQQVQRVRCERLLRQQQPTAEVAAVPALPCMLPHPYCVLTLSLTLQVQSHLRYVQPRLYCCRSILGRCAATSQFSNEMCWHVAKRQLNCQLFACSHAHVLERRSRVSHALVSALSLHCCWCLQVQAMHSSCAHYSAAGARNAGSSTSSSSSELFGSSSSLHNPFPLQLGLLHAHRHSSCQAVGTGPSSSSCSSSSSSSSSARAYATSASPLQQTDLAVSDAGAGSNQDQGPQLSPAEQPKQVVGQCNRKNLKCGWKKIDFVLRMVSSASEAAI